MKTIMTGIYKGAATLLAAGLISGCMSESMMAAMEEQGNSLHALYFSQQLPDTAAQIRYRLVGNGRGGSQLCGYTDASTSNDRTLAADMLDHGKLTLAGRTYDVDMTPLAAARERCVNTDVAWDFDLPMHEMDLGVSDASVYAYVE
ncbi:hypothetical protein SAMN06273572_10791 [Monaibacterium marinum]|uniref:Lipoprotein n=1 Tax=Pontivivens marinum TaxID=1690039 RepID=A0A2C9CV32_9RHOB|nr:hypothetical protein [Monaibacterium marinum]SOH95070.1 hypothetical protein SAMN06273572_10791 [Monaibacterium marinum]